MMKNNGAKSGLWNPIITLFLILITALNFQNGFSQTVSWPIFRGNTNLTGIAQGEIPEKLSLLWTFATGDDIKSSPVVANGKVYVGSDDGSVYALDLTSGKKIWAYTTEHAFEASPLVLNQTVYIGALNGELFALEAEKGTLKWSYKTESKIIGSANWIKLKDKTALIVGSYDFKIHCVDVETGKLIWSYQTDNFINGCPATDGQRIIFGGCDANMHVVAAQTGKLITQIDIGSYIAGSGAIRDDHAFIGHYGNQFVSVDLNLQKIRWEFGDAENGAPFFSSPAVTENRVVVGSRDEFVYCIDKATGKEIWKFQTLDEVDSSPVICDNKVVVGSADGRVYMLNLENGEQIWSYEIGAPISTSPAVVDGKVIVGAEDGRIYVFGQAKTSKIINR